MKLPALREIVEERKGKAIETLSARFAENRLPLEEYERLVEYINKIESERELVIVENMVAGFGDDERDEKENKKDKENKENSRPGVSQTNRARRETAYQTHTSGEEERGISRSTRNHFSILSSRSFSGPVRSGDQFVSFMGNQEVYVRDLRPGRTELRVAVLMGNLEVYVARGIRVIVDAVPIMGNVDIHTGEEREEAVDGGPVLVIAGAALMGNIEIKRL
jgi:hypothetical protein